MPTFTCSICGDVHEGLPTDWAYTLPDDVWAIPEAQRSDAAQFNSDLCRYGQRYFIRCLLPLALPGAGSEFNFGAWAEVERTVFERYYELYDEDGRGEPPYPARLANALSPYPGSLGAAVELQFRDPTTRPSLRLPEDSTSLLASEQRSGIDGVRHHEILDILWGRATSPS
jgi:hypothetical protein